MYTVVVEILKILIRGMECGIYLRDIITECGLVQL